MANTFDEYLEQYGRPDDPYPVIDLDTADQRRTVIVTFAGGAKKAIVQFIGLAAGTDNEQLCIDVHGFVDDAAARSGVFGMENGRRYEGFDETAPGRSHGWPAVRGVTVLVGTQTNAAATARISSAFAPTTSMRWSSPPRTPSARASRRSAAASSSWRCAPTSCCTRRSMTEPAAPVMPRQTDPTAQD